MTPREALGAFLSLLRGNGCADLAERFEAMPAPTEAISSGWLERGLAERSRLARWAHETERAKVLGRAIEMSWRVGFALLSEAAGDAKSASYWTAAALRALESP